MMFMDEEDSGLIKTQNNARGYQGVHPIINDSDPDEKFVKQKNKSPRGIIYFNSF